MASCRGCLDRCRKSGSTPTHHQNLALLGWFVQDGERGAISRYGLSSDGEEQTRKISGDRPHDTNEWRTPGGIQTYSCRPR